jgi:hypothetical protein
MRVRRKTVEHPIGTLKAWMRYTHFLTKTIPRVSTETSLHVLAYNMKRMIEVSKGVGPNAPHRLFHRAHSKPANLFRGRLLAAVGRFATLFGTVLQPPRQPHLNTSAL